MAGHDQDGVVPHLSGYRLRFLNADWNDSIANGEPFLLRWNQSLDRTASELQLFQVKYPMNGLVQYHLVTNLSGPSPGRIAPLLNPFLTSQPLKFSAHRWKGSSDLIDSTWCMWTPEDLNKELYALRLTTGHNPHLNWTMSPPWMPQHQVCYPRAWPALGLCQPTDLTNGAIAR